MLQIETNWRDGDVSIESVIDKTITHDVEINGQRLNVVHADGRQSESDQPTILWPQAFMARACDPVEVYRVQLLAARLKASVASVDRPGVRFDPEMGSETQTGNPHFSHILKAAAKGDLADLTETQLHALDSVLRFRNGEELHAVGYSFGAWSASTMATVLGRQPFGANRQPVISNLTLLEATNDQPGRLRQLRTGIAKESCDQNLSRYLNHNTILGAPEALFFDWESPFSRSSEGARVHATLDKRQAPSLFLPALGMRRGFARGLAEAVRTSDNTTRLHEAKISIIRASGSIIARPDAHEHTAHMLEDAGVKPELIELTPSYGEPPHRHPIVLSMGEMAFFADVILSRR